MKRKIPPLTKDGFALEVNQEVGEVQAHQKALRAAGNIGTQVHNRIDYVLDTDPPPNGLGHDRGTPPPLSSPEAERCFQKWCDWRKTVTIHPICVEEKVFSEHFGYAGTLDLLAHVDFGDGHLVETVIDWKSSKSIYETHILQVSAYSRAVEEMGLGTPEREAVVRIPKTESDTIEVKVCPPRDEVMPAFLATKTLFEFWFPYQIARKRSKKQTKKRTPKKDAPS